MTDQSIRPAGDDEWSPLVLAAGAVMKNAYAPYSKFKVGAAAMTVDGRVVVGCNVENASYGLGLCAECGLVSQLHLSGGGRIARFVCVDQHGDLLMPCGRCRQLLWEHASADAQILTPLGILSFESILPQAFGPDDLVERAES